METIILVVHLLIGLSLVGVVLLQRSEGGLGGLGGGGGGGGGGGMGGLLGNRQTANLLTRSTAVLAALFMLTSVSLAVLAGGHSSGGGSIVNETPGAPQSDGMTPVPTLPTTPTVPTTE
ncbi:MAG: preprotein translocase subunit SecG [Alphaproteobacteria bacterium]|jgi:preprotein translocase subunit SecG